MPRTNSVSSYGSVAKTFHWLTAILIFTVVPLGIVANDLAHDIRAADVATSDADAARAAFLFSMHKTLGLTIFAVAVLRILWALFQPKPRLLNGANKTEAFLAQTVHWLLYGSLVLVPLTGWFHHAATTGFAPIWWPFGQTIAFIPQSQPVATVFAGLHVVLERVLLVAIVLHVLGALKHHFMDKDATLLRMLPGQSDAPVPPEHQHSSYSAMVALIIWGMALAAGNAAGVFTPPKTDVPVAQLEQVASQWQVDSGELTLRIVQLGATVTGHFQDWTAAIEFDDPGTLGPVGTVEVTIAIGSLKLASVTDQASGPDFFDTQTFPTAVFRGQISRTESGLVATGPLTLKGKSQAITLPFDLIQSGDTAQMTASLQLNRLDFGIGESMPEEGSLALGVDVSIALTATRNTD